MASGSTINLNNARVAILVDPGFCNSSNQKMIFPLLLISVGDVKNILLFMMARQYYEIISNGVSIMRGHKITKPDNAFVCDASR